MKCNIDGCANKVFASGYCLRHYRFAKYGTCVLDGCQSPARGKDGICDNCNRFGPPAKRHIGKSINTKTHKYCELCKEFKNRDDFYVDRGNSSYACKVCHADRRPRAKRRKEAWDFGQLYVVQTSAHLCVKCWQPLGEWEADHIIPYSLGGTHDIESNIQIMCRDCNGEKSNKEAIDYRVWIKEDEEDTK